MMAYFLDGVERELGSPVSVKTKMALDAFRRQLSEGRIIRRHKRFEQELEIFLQSEPFLRGAAERYLTKKIGPAIEAAIAALEQARSFLAKVRTKRRA